MQGLPKILAIAWICQERHKKQSCMLEPAGCGMHRVAGVPAAASKLDEPSCLPAAGCWQPPPAVTSLHTGLPAASRSSAAA